MGNANRFYVDVMSLHNEVTGSCILNIIKFPDGSTKKVLIDCGLFQEMEYSELNKSLPFNAADIDYVIVTHDHVDHTGRIPLLVSNGYRKKIHMSHDTSVLLPKALHDSAKLLKKKAELDNEPVLYTDDDVENTLPLIEAHPFEESIRLDNNIKLTFFMNGHLPGAIIVLMQISYHDREKHYENINMLYTGDYNNKNIFFDVNPVPKWVHQLPINIIQEATYGSMNSDEIEYVFEKNILEAISNNYEIVIPVFSLGRAQEIMYLLKKWQDEGKLSKDIPIYFDGKLGIRYTEIYKAGAIFIKEDCKEFIPENFTYVTDCHIRETILQDNKCKIILTTSGMGSHGPAQVYLPTFLRRKKALIHFTGYVAEGTLGRRLFDCQKDAIVDISGLQVKKLADVKFTSEFSAHAKADELIQFLKDFEDIKLLLINHGDINKKNIYANRVINEIDPKDVGILSREYLFRLNGYGFVKSFTTKFD